MSAGKVSVRALNIPTSSRTTPWAFFVYDDRWRIVAVYRQGSTTSSSLTSAATLKERYVHHFAGTNGMGGSSYIDSVAKRDRDVVDDAELEEERYYLQNWRADVVGLMREDGLLPSQFKYSAYGRHTQVLLADVDDGNGAGRKDGGVGTEDLLLYLELYDAGGAAADSRLMYAGYVHDRDVDLCHVRHRVYSAELGRWLTQDPLGYVDGMSLCEYVGGRVQRFVDPRGLLASPRSTRPQHQSDIRDDCGVKIMRDPSSGGHEWIEIMPIDGNGYGVGFWPGGWATPDFRPTRGRHNPFSPGWIDRSKPQAPVPGGDPYGPHGPARAKVKTPVQTKVKIRTPSGFGLFGVGHLQFGSAAGKSCEQATCENIHACLRQFVPSKPYKLDIGFSDYHCRHASEEAIESCCLD